MISGHRDIEHGLRSITPQAEFVLDSEVFHVLRTCDAAAALEGPLSFAPGRELPALLWNAAWQTWLAETFSEVIAPVLLSSAGQARLGQFREIVATDTALSGSFDAATMERSRSAGRKMLRRLAGARGVRWLDRLQTAAQTDSTPGHFAVVYGCQAAFFHVAPRLMLATYAYWEWAAALVACRQPRDGAVAVFQGISAPALQRINEKLLSPLSTNADETHRALP